MLIPKCFVYLVPGCDKFVLVGDGICNDETNNAVCRFDGGDCCLDVIHSNCSECICYFGQICAANFHPLVGDGFCNDETNIGSCNYDGGDCCGMNQSNSQRERLSEKRKNDSAYHLNVDKAPFMYQMGTF